MKTPIEILSLDTRDSSGESAVFTNDAPDAVRAGAFVVEVQEMDEGAALVVTVADADNTFVLASNRIERPCKTTIAIGPGLGLPQADVIAPGTHLPEQYKVRYVAAHGAVKFSVRASVI
jgi:hypothetical protein